MRASSWISAICVAAALPGCGPEPSPSPKTSATPTATSAAGADQPATTGAVTPNSGTGKTQAFTAVYSHPQGATKVINAWFLVEKSLTGKNSCFLQYSPTTNAINLMTDAGQWQTPVRAGTAGALTNSQCSVDTGGVRADSKDNDVSVTFPITFKPTYAGPKQIYTAALGPNSPAVWVDKGRWTAP